MPNSTLVLKSLDFKMLKIFAQISTSYITVRFAFKYIYVYLDMYLSICTSTQNVIPSKCVAVFLYLIGSPYVTVLFILEITFWLWAFLGPINSFDPFWFLRAYGTQYHQIPVLFSHLLLLASTTRNSSIVVCCFLLSLHRNIAKVFRYIGKYY